MSPSPRGRGASARAAALTFAVVLVATALPGCGESASSDATDGAAADGETSLGPINLADCADWLRASDEARRQSIDDIAQFAGGPVAATGGGEGATVSDAEAYQLFENTCANEYARAFKLYKLYTRGAAFAGP